MNKFLRNLIISAIVMICGIVLYQVKLVVDAYSVNGVVTSISSGVLYSTGTQFDVYFVGLAGHSNGDQLKAFLSDSINTGDLNTKPRTSRITLGAAQPGRTGSINVGTGYENFTGDTLYLHILVTDPSGTVVKGGGEQEIAFVGGGGGGGGGMPDILINELALHASGDFIELMALTGEQGINLTGWNVKIYSSTGELMSTQPLDGFLPKYGLLTFSYDLDDAGGQIKIKNPGDDTKAELSYGANNTGTYAGSIGANQSAEAIRSGTGITFAVTGNITRGRFRGAQDVVDCNELNSNFDENFIPTLSSIAVCLLSEQGINTNMGTLADPTNTPATGANRLYFERPGVGNLIFNEHINLTDQNTVKIVQTMGQQLNMQSPGKIGFDTDIVGSGTTFDSTVLEQASATIIMYNVNPLGVYGPLNSGFIMSRDSDSGTLLSGVAVPDLTSFAYTGLNSGSLSFITNHFTSFEIARVRNITQMIGYDTIQEAINGASSGDTITVASGMYIENITINTGVILSGLNSPVISGMVTFTAIGTMTGFIAQNVTIDAAGGGPKIQPGINALSEGGTLYINGGSDSGSPLRYNDSDMYINKTITITKTGTVRPEIACDGGTGFTINTGGVIIKDLYFLNCSPTMLINSISSPITLLNNGLNGLIDNESSQQIIATGNRRGSLYEPMVGTDFSGNMLYIPRCINEACTGLNYTGYADSRVRNITHTGGYDTIQDAIDNLFYDGDIITVASGVYTEDIILHNGPFTLSGLGSPIISGTITLKDSTDSIITITGFAPIYTLYADIANVGPTDQYYTLSNAISYIASGGTIYIDGGSLGGEFAYQYYAEDAEITINKSMSIIGTGLYRPSILFDNAGRLIVNAPNVIFRNIDFDANYGLGDSMIQVQQVAGVSFSNCAFNNGALENINASSLSATGNYRYGDPVRGISFSGNVNYAPRCDDSACTTFSDDFTALSGLTVSTGTLSGTFSVAVTGYTVNLPDLWTGTLTATPTKSNSNSTVTGNYSLPLNTAGSTGSIIITVISPDGTTSGTYTISVLRDPSADATLSGLITNTGILYGFTGLEIPYSFSGTISLTPTPTNILATATGNYSAPFALGVTGTLTITIIAADGITSGNYSVNVFRGAPSTDANLSALSVVTGGVLSGSFSSGTYAYTINLPYQQVGSVEITGTKNHQFATITSGVYSKTLTVGSTGTMFIAIQSESGSGKTYTVTITRSAPSTDTTLSGLTTNTGILYGFTGVEVPYTFSGTVSLTPTATHPYATISGNYSAPFALGQTGTLTVVVRAEDGTTTGTYNINVFRTAPSTDATLASLTLTGGTLSPTFSGAVTGYTVNYAYSQTGTVSITGVKNNTYATITSGILSSNLTVGSTGSMFITVTAQDSSTKTYTVTITRSPASSDANLSSLSVSPGALSGAFNSGTNTYTVNYAYSYTGTVSITGAKNDTFAVITGASLSVNLTAAGQTGSMYITVQAENGTTKTYTITITRSPASSDANLSGLTVIGGALSGSFSSGIYVYTINLPYSQLGSVEITGTKNDTYAVITGASTSVNLTTVGQTGSMYITVQSESGNTNTYTVTITRSPASTDANLSGLTISTGTLSPTFSSGTITYTVNFAYSYTGTVSITGTKNHTYATITSGILSSNLTVGSTGTMFIAIQSESGNIKTYTVTITRTPASTDANLTSLTVSTGTLSPSFSSGTIGYNLQMIYSYIGTITATPTKSHAYATISGTNSIDLTAGQTGSLMSTVTAEDGTTNKTYTINVTRSAPPSVGVDTIDGTVTVTGGSTTISGATATGATFTSTGTLHVVGDTTNDYLEIAVSGFVITASGGTWNDVLIAPTDLATGDTHNATIGEIGLTNTSTTTYTVLLTIQAGATTDSLAASGGYFNISFVVPTGTVGDTINLYRSENGSTWVANTPSATCTLNASKVCSFQTDHLSYFATVKVTTSSGGGSNGGGAGTAATKDVCPNGDFSSSFYDETCEATTTATGTTSTTLGSTIGSPYSTELNNAYLYAYSIGITTKATIQQADIGGKLIRAHMAKMMVNYATKESHNMLNSSTGCDYADLAGQTDEMKMYIKLACQLGIMGVGPDGTPAKNFNPNGTVTRAEFGTVLSRVLRGSQHENTQIYYKDHLQALKDAGIITNVTAGLQEQRGFVMLMLMRADK